MRDWKGFCKKMLFLPIWLIVILVLFSTASLLFVFLKGLETSPIAYVIYVLAFYSLTVLCILCWKTWPTYYRKVKNKIYSNSFANRYLSEADYKTHVNLHVSLAINLIYVAVNAISAFVYSTNWFGIFAVYYAIMAIMRFLLVRYVGKAKIGENRLGELKRSRLCAYILLTVNLALSGAVLMMISFGRGFEYEGFLIYVMAMYTFYITTTAIIDLIKYRKYQSPIMSISMVIKLAAALMSMLSLETAMLSQFGQDSSPEMHKIMIIATGAGISLVVLVLSVYMIYTSSKEIRSLKNNISET